MTPGQRENFERLFGFPPCFKTWGSSTSGAPISHHCTMKIGHTGRCACCCDAGNPHQAPLDPRYKGDEGASEGRAVRQPSGGAAQTLSIDAIEALINDDVAIDIQHDGSVIVNGERGDF